MSADEVFLELAAVFLGNGNTAKGTEPGCHPVNNSFIIYDIIDKGTGSLDAVNSVRICLLYTSRLKNAPQEYAP